MENMDITVIPIIIGAIGKLEVKGSTETTAHLKRLQKIRTVLVT